MTTAADQPYPADPYYYGGAYAQPVPPVPPVQSPVAGLRASASHLRGHVPSAVLPLRRMPGPAPYAATTAAPYPAPVPVVSPAMPLGNPAPSAAPAGGQVMTMEQGAAAWRAERISDTLAGLNDMAHIGVSGGQAVRSQLRKLLDTVMFVLGRMSPQEGCVALGALHAATRRALSTPLQGTELLADEVASVLCTTGGEVLLEDCGFEKFEPPPPAEEEMIEEEYEEDEAEEEGAPPRVGAAPKATKTTTVKKKVLAKPKAAGPAPRYLEPKKGTATTKKAASSKADKLGKKEMPTGLSKFESSLWAAFELADKDGSGALDQKEFTSALKATGLVETDAEARREWTATDTDKSGLVEWKEFLRLGKRRKVLSTLPKVLQAKPEKVEAAANVIQLRLRKRAGGDAAAAAKPAAAPAPKTAASLAPVASSSKASAPPPATPPASSAGAPSFSSRAPRPYPDGLSKFEKKLWRTFDALLADDDTSMSLSRRELDGALWAARMSMGQLRTKQLASLFAQADANADGRIDWDEFKNFGAQMPFLAELDPGETEAPAEPQAPADLFRDAPMWVILPCTSPQGLAFLRGTAELLERCLTAWVHWSTEEDASGSPPEFSDWEEGLGADVRRAAGHGPSPQLSAHAAKASPASKFAAATHQFRYQDAGASPHAALHPPPPPPPPPDVPLAYIHPALPPSPVHAMQPLGASAAGTLRVAPPLAPSLVPPTYGISPVAAPLTAPVATHRRLEYVYQSGYGRGRQDGVADGFGEGAARGYGQGRVQGYAEGVSSGKVQGKAEGAYEGFGAGHYHGHRDGYEQGLAYGHRQGFETGREDGKKAGRAEGFDQGRHEGKMAGLAEGKDVGIAEGRSEGQRLGFETGVQEGLAKGRHEGYQHGHADGYDERAHFEAEARRLAALPRFVRPPRRSTSPPYQQAPWRPPGNSSSEPLSAAAAAARSRYGREGSALLSREGPKRAAYDILKRTADELAHLKM